MGRAARRRAGPELVVHRCSTLSAARESPPTPQGPRTLPASRRPWVGARAVRSPPRSSGPQGVDVEVGVSVVEGVLVEGVVVGGAVVGGAVVGGAVVGGSPAS
jgi:hypothetical protein